MHGLTEGVEVDVALLLVVEKIERARLAKRSRAGAVGDLLRRAARIRVAGAPPGPVEGGDVELISEDQRVSRRMMVG
jgi:hypothetical protein